MLKFRLICALTLLTSSPSFAADSLTIAPPDSWVLQTAALPVASSADEAPVDNLVQESQVQLGGGSTKVFARLVLEIRQPEGLNAISTIVIPWQPDTDTLTVHWLRLHRKGQIIDLLAKGQKFTVLRREAKLERAVLDGTLTAVIQPEGVRVGDAVDMAYTITQKDAVLGAHDEFLTRILNPMPIERLRLRISWPKTEPMRVRFGPQLPRPVMQTEGERTIVDFETKALPPPRLPKRAPLRYLNLFNVELTDLADWQSLAALMQPLYSKAATLDPQSDLHSEINQIALSSADPLTRAEAALRLVQDQVRYVFLAVGTSGYEPASVETTWQRRYGDCKAKSVLLVALLRKLGIEATPVLVSSQNGDGLDSRLPLLQHFDHVIVQARINDRLYWLDGTGTGDRSLEALEPPGFKWGLPLDNSVGLIKIAQTPLRQPQVIRTLKLDASLGLNVPASALAEHVYRGDAAISMSQSLNVLAPADKEQALRRFWQERYDWIRIDKVTFSFDKDQRETRLTMEGKGRMGWQIRPGTQRQRYRSGASVVAYSPDFEREEGSDTSAPFALHFPDFTEDHETVILPNKGRGFSLAGKDIDQTLAGVSYRRTASLLEGTVKIYVSERTLVPEFSAAEAKRAEPLLSRLNDDTVYILAPLAYGWD